MPATIVHSAFFALILSLVVIGCGGTQPPTDTDDMAGAGDAGLKAFGEACAADAECDFCKP